MIPVIEIKFEPFSSGLFQSKQIGKIRAELVLVPVYEAIRGGYYMAFPGHWDKDIEELQKTKVKSLPGFLREELKGKVADSLPVMDFFSICVKEEEKAVVLGTERSQLRHFQTVQFIRSLPSTPSELMKAVNVDDICAVTDRADYSDLVKLALERAKALWSREFVQNLVKRIARGTADGDFVSWADVRAHMHALKPDTKGRLKSWDDFYAMDLENLFTPKDFDQKDDVVIATVMKDKLLSLDSVRDTYCTPGLYDKNRFFLHHSLASPQSDKRPLPHWMATFDDTGLVRWDLDYSTNTALLQPGNGTTYARLQKHLKDVADAPEMTTLPYKIKWEHLDNLVKLVLPWKISTGVTIHCPTELPPLLSFKRVAPIKEVPTSVIEHVLKEMGLWVKGGAKADTQKAFVELLADMYPQFEEQVDAALSGKPLIRVTPNIPPDQKGVEPIQSVLFPKYPYDLVSDYLMAFYLCRHMRGKAILDPEYVSDLYTPEGIFGDLVKSGYPPTDATFASGKLKDKKGNPVPVEALFFSCAFGKPGGVSSTDWKMKESKKTSRKESVEQPRTADIQVSDFDELLEDLL